MPSQISDTFNGTDQSPLVSSTEGWSYTQIEGSFSTGRIDRSSNRAVVICNGQNATFRAEQDLTSSDHFAEADIHSTATNNYQGLLLRAHSSDLTYYLAFADRPNQQIQIYKRVTGTYELLTTRAVTIANSVTYRFKFSIELDVLKVFFDSVQIGADLIDGSITSGLRSGIWGNSTLLAAGDGWLDNFVAASLGSPGKRFRSYII